MTALLFLRSYGKAIAGGLLVLVLLTLVTALSITRHTLAKRTRERDEARQTLAGQIASYRAAAEQARAKAKAVEARNNEIRQETQNAIEFQLADARARAADHARRLSGAQAEADTGDSGERMPTTSDSALDPDRSRPQTLLADDLAACSENTVKAQAWKDWWEKVSQTVSAQRDF